MRLWMVCDVGIECDKWAIHNITIR
jgi:hypothetical protein